MPVYEYECEHCGLRFDRLQRFSDNPITECPNCSGAVHRVMQPVGIIFKGSGFYVTDNRSKSPTTPPSKRENDRKPDAKEASAAAPATESKPDA